MLARHEYIGEMCSEKFELLTAYPEDRIQCKRCNDLSCKAELSFDWGRTSAFSQASEQAFGVRYYKNPETGHVIVAGTQFSKPPAGYRVETTTSFREVQKLEKELNKQEEAFSGKKREVLAQYDEMDRKQLRANAINPNQLEQMAQEQKQIRELEVSAYGEQMGADGIREYKPTIEDPSARARLGVEVERAYLDTLDKQASSFTAIDPGIHFDVLHQDSKKATA